MATEPLLFPSRKASQVDVDQVHRDVTRGYRGRLACMLCDWGGGEDVTRDALLKHLVEAHRLVIADVGQIADLAAYTQHWRQRLGAGDVTLADIASAIDTGPMPDAPPVRYHMLSDILPEDRQLRERLGRDRLASLLAVQQHERSPGPGTGQPWPCLFCKDPAGGGPPATRDALFAHMLDAHQFNIGLPDNVVFVRQFLAGLQTMLDQCQCLYCEKTFPSHAILRAHMRKKHHFKINPKNAAWDTYYLVNYRELGKSWDPLQGSLRSAARGEGEGDADGSADERDPSDAGDDQWEDWAEDSDAHDDTYCLFCSAAAADPHDIVGHMSDAHGFNFRSLDFYQRVKSVNYLRRQAHLLRCGFCDEQCESKDAYMRHVESEGHARLPDNKGAWDQPQFFFPTFENDPLLTALEDPAEVHDS